MQQSGPIIIIEDDKDDQEILQEILVEIGIQNKLLFFDRYSNAFRHFKMTAEHPFLILSDVNLPEQDGVEFKRQNDEVPQLRENSIPFVFLSTSADKKSVDYCLQGNGRARLFSKEIKLR